MAKRRRWSDEQDRALVEAYLDGCGVAVLAARYATSEDNVRQKLHRLRVRRPPQAKPLGGVPKTLQAPQDASQDEDFAKAILGHLGITAPHERPEAHVPREALAEVAGSYETFNRHVLRIEHPPYQLEAIQAILSEPLVAVVTGRQIGFSGYILAPAVVFYAVTHPYSTVLITSLTQRQSTYLLGRIRNLIADNAALKGSLVDVSQERLRLSNGTEILSLPSGIDGSSLRGYSPNLAIVDRDEGVRLAIGDIINFNDEVSGLSVFIK